MKKSTDSYNERMKRFWHYWNMKNATEEMIETSSGELRIIIDALADYHDIVMEKVKVMEGYAEAAWINRADKIKKIQTKLEESIGYSRDKQIEVCQKKKSKKQDDIGGDALELAFNRSANKKENKPENKPENRPLEGKEDKKEESNQLNIFDLVGGK